MKKNPFLHLLLLFLAINTGSAFAHALYIDTPSQGEVDKPQKVSIYYSEFEDRTLEKVTDWYSDVPDFELWLVKPNGTRVQLATTAQEDSFNAQFTPENNGAYRLEISHIAEDPAENTAYQFNAFAEVSVGTSTQLTPVTKKSPQLVLVREEQTPGKSSMTFKTFFKGVPKEGIKATLFLPSGEKKEIQSDSKGILKIELEARGVYFLEATTYDEDEPGHTGKAPYGAIWRCATQKLERS